MNELFFEIKKAIDHSQKILIFSHPDIDGDALGAMLALEIAFSTAGKKIDMFSLSGIPGAFKFLPRIERVGQRLGNNYDLIFGLDYGDIRRLEPAILALCSKCRVISIDHHVLVNQIGEIKITDTSFSSTCEIIYQFLEVNSLQINKEIATCLLTGIIYDTWCFRHPNTSAQTLNVAANLISKGAVLNKIVRLMSQGGANHKFRIWGKALANVCLNKEIGLAFCFLDFQEIKQMRATPDHLAGICSIISMAPEARFSLFLREFKPGCLDGSLRSNIESGIDVSQIARLFGGGGHKLAAGFKTSGRPEIVLEKIKKYVMMNNA